MGKKYFYFVSKIHRKWRLTEQINVLFVIWTKISEGNDVLISVFLIVLKCCCSFFKRAIRILVLLKNLKEKKTTMREKNNLSIKE